MPLEASSNACLFIGLARMAPVSAKLHTSSPVAADRITCTLIPGDGVGKFSIKPAQDHYNDFL